MAALEVFEILSPGILTSVQDLGRYGCGRYGVAPSGALDSFSLRIANLLVGNPEDQAGLETTLLGLRIRALNDIVIAVTGGNLQPQRNKQPIEMWRSHVLKKDDILSFNAPVSGFRAYIGLGGGICVPCVMDSKSTNLPSCFGGYQGRQLILGDIVLSDSASRHLDATGRVFRRQWIPVYTNNWTLRVIRGPQDDHFPNGSRDVFLHASYKMSLDSDRTGIRLLGPVLQ